MKDFGRYRICEEIAKSVPYSVDEIYDTYEYIINKKKEQIPYITILLNDQLLQMKLLLQCSLAFQIPPLKLAQAIYES